ncbi:5' nucleotidase, NT5C type [Occallatibacter riparius]|uniref:PQ-loop domain-containing transporter n=1 Tax=Occallatibacter riparius TaxID=1002689 RepID=A0A9J7BKK4_9BACT|nr:PQ-loop domain-containing transporter [Occallatibacter riparius]UWZ83123.1 PQ-loop domain-containing transporter [Occallatibacter riparius]
MKELATPILGAAATLASTVAFVPQIRKIRQTGGEDVSVAMLSLYVTGVTLWLLYGVSIHAIALSLANGASIAFAGACLILKLRSDQRKSATHQKKRLRIAIDMDGTIADSVKEQVRRYNAQFAESISVADLRGTGLEEIVPPERREAVRRAIHDESFFDALDVIDNAREVIQELIREHDVFIVSAAMEIPESFAAKHRWLRKHFPFIPERNVVFCGDKSLIEADYLIDDEARHFAKFKGVGLLFSAPHNASETRYRRIDHWLEIRREFLPPQTPTHTPSLAHGAPAEELQ